MRRRVLTAAGRDPRPRARDVEHRCSGLGRARRLRRPARRAADRADARARGAVRRRAGPGARGRRRGSRAGSCRTGRPEGEVVVSDVAPEMTEIAAARAEALGLANVTTRVLDLERIDEPDARFDVVLCRDGLMLAPQPERAAAELHRVLRPGGRFALAVWGPRERQPVARRGLRRGRRAARHADPAARRARALLAGRPRPAGRDARGRRTDRGRGRGARRCRTARARSRSGLRARRRSRGRSVQRIASLPAPAQEALAARVREAARAYETAEGLEFPGLALVASGRA